MTEAQSSINDGSTTENEAALRELDWKVREAALNDNRLSARERYELLTFGLGGPSEKHKSELNKLASSIGGLVLIGGSSKNFNRGFIGHVTDANFVIDNDLYCLDHIFGDIVGHVTKVVLDVPNLTDCYADDMGFDTTKNKSSFRLSLNRSHPSARAKEGKVELFERIAISPRIDHYDETGIAVFDFTAPFSTREVWREKRFGSIFHMMKEPTILIREGAETWLKEHVRNTQEFMNEYYEMQSEPSFS